MTRLYWRSAARTRAARTPSPAQRIPYTTRAALKTKAELQDSGAVRENAFCAVDLSVGDALAVGEDELRRAA
jgi:hypothetical protein